MLLTAEMHLHCAWTVCLGGGGGGCDGGTVINAQSRHRVGGRALGEESRHAAAQVSRAGDLFRHVMSQGALSMDGFIGRLLIA